jgi:VWFA-related protein
MSSSLVGALVLAAALVSAQEPTPEGEGTEGPPVFETGTELVRLDLVVRDEDGDLIRDLGRDEIQVFEDGHSVPISSLRLVDADGADRLRARPISSPGRDEGPSTSPRPASAAGPEDASLTSVVVLLFDTLQGRAAQAAQKAALQFIGRPFPENTWFGVFKATRVGLVTVHAFTEKPRSLEDAIRAATGGADVRYDQTIDLAADTRARPFRSDSPADAAMKRVLQQMGYFESLLMREERGRSSLYPLLTLSRSLRGVQGRKTLLHFSQGIEVTPDIDHLLLNAISEANRSNLAIYTFDARGLFEVSPFSGVRSALHATIPAEAFMGPAQLSAMQQGTGGARGVSKVEIRRPDAALDALRLNVQENLRELAEGTSGFLVANSNDLRPGLERVSRDLRAFYEIAYVPPNPEADGTFRRIDVQVARAGARVRVRKGYYALPPGVPVIHPWEVSLAQALERDLLPRELPLRAGAVRLAPDLRASRAVVLVEVPLGALQARVDPETGHWSTHVSMVAFVKDARDRVVARLSQDWPLEGQGPTSGLGGRNVLLKRTLDLAPGRYTLEAAAHDRHGGHLGARRVPFLVPENAPGPALGSVSVVRFQPAPPDHRDPHDPLLLQGPLGQRTLVRALPVLGAPIPIEAGQLGLLASLRPERDAGPFSVTVEFRRDGRILAEASPEIPRPDPAGHIILARVFDLPSTQPGRYQVHVRMRQGDQEVSTATSFRLARADPFGVLPGVVARH